jgi:hypothetical protein
MRLITPSVQSLANQSCSYEAHLLAQLAIFLSIGDDFRVKRLEVFVFVVFLLVGFLGVCVVDLCVCVSVCVYVCMCV